MGSHGLKAEVCGVAGATLQASARAFWRTEWVADSSAVVSSGHGALNSDASEVFATADAPEDQSPSPLKRRRREGHTTVPAVLTRLEAWLEESALPWTALPPADSDELTEILRELGFSALDRVKAREALRAQAGTFFFMITS